MNTNYWDDCYRRMSGSNAGDYDGWLGAYRPCLCGARVLDLGCGAGTDIPALVALGAWVTAADLSPEATRLVREAHGADLVRADCFDMLDGFPYADEAFDALISDLSLHYFSRKDTRRIIAGIGRILRVGGVLIARLHSVRNLDPGRAERIGEGYYMVDGCARSYFTPEDIRSLFAGWKLRFLEEKTADRYGLKKKVIEFCAEKAR